MGGWLESTAKGGERWRVIAAPSACCVQPVSCHLPSGRAEILAFAVSSPSFRNFATWSRRSVRRRIPMLASSSLGEPPSGMTGKAPMTRSRTVSARSASLSRRACPWEVWRRARNGSTRSLRARRRRPPPLRRLADAGLGNPRSSSFSPALGRTRSGAWRRTCRGGVRVRSRARRRRKRTRSGRR